MKPFFSLQNRAAKTILMESIARYDNHMVRFYPQTQTFEQISPQFEQIKDCFVYSHPHSITWRFDSAIKMLSRDINTATKRFLCTSPTN